MYDDPLEQKLERELAKYGFSYHAIVRQAFARAAQRRRKRQRLPLDPFVLLERLVAQFVRAAEQRLRR